MQLDILTKLSALVPPGESYAVKATIDRECTIAVLWLDPGKLVEIEPEPTEAALKPDELQLHEEVRHRLVGDASGGFELLKITVQDVVVVDLVDNPQPMSLYRCCGIGGFVAGGPTGEAVVHSYLANGGDVELLLRNTTAEPRQFEAEIRGTWMGRDLQVDAAVDSSPAEPTVLPQGTTPGLRAPDAEPE